MRHSLHIADESPEAPATERPDSAPAASRQWGRVMTFNDFSYEQTRVVRDAVEMAVRPLVDGEHRRIEIAKVILSIAD